MMKASGEIFTIDDLALGGYDVVQIYEQGEVLRGIPKFHHKCRGAIWNFANAENLATFKKNPLKYLPAYGGYCAYGVSQGYKAPTLIHLYEVVDGVLYFNFSPYIKRYWVRNREVLIKQANALWPGARNDEMIRVNYYWIYLKYVIFKLLRIPFFGKLEVA